MTSHAFTEVRSKQLENKTSLQTSKSNPTFTLHTLYNNDTYTMLHDVSRHPDLHTYMHRTRLIMSQSYKYLYIHGFASSPNSTKAVVLKQYMKQNNIDLHTPDCNIPSFDKLSINSITQQFECEIRNTPVQYRLIGSSLGGLIAVILANKLTNKHIESVILLCPAFNALARWTDRMSSNDIDKWKSAGTRNYYNYATNSEQPLHYSFYDELHTISDYPLVDCPVYIVHGTEDDVVPLLASHIYIDKLTQHRTQQQQSVNDIQLITVQDDHALGKADTIEHIKQLVNDKWLSNARTPH